MIELLAIIHILLLGMIYRFFKRDLTSPSFLFVSGFVVASYFAYCYKSEWDLGLHSNTFFLIS